MARRISTYDLFRKIHLFTGMSILGFILMYFITGYAMTHNRWFTKEPPTITTKNYALDMPDNMQLEELSIYLQKRFNLSGKRQKPMKRDDGRWVFKYSRPGHHYKMILSPDKKNAIIETSKENPHRTFTLFHRIHGYGGGWIYDIFVFMMDLASIALIIFAITGTYMWYKTFKHKMLGWIILALSIGYTFTIIFSFMNA